MYSAVIQMKLRHALGNFARGFLGSRASVSCAVSCLLMAPAAVADADVGLVDQDYPWLREFQIRDFESRGIVREVVADLLFIAPRHLFAFNLRSFNEIRLISPTVKIYFLTDVAVEPKSNPSLAGDILAMDLVAPGAMHDRRPYGIVTRMVSDDVTVEIFKSHGAPAVILRARKAYSTGKQPNPKFYNASLESPGLRKVIVADKVIWSSDRNLFMIPGDYVARTPQGVAKGRSIQVDLDFVVTPL